MSNSNVRRADWFAGLGDERHGAARLAGSPMLIPLRLGNILRAPLRQPCALASVANGDWSGCPVVPQVVSPWGGRSMVDARYRNPAWVTNQVMAENSGLSLWSARFTMSTSEGLERAKAGLVEAGAWRVFADGDSTHVMVVQFDPVLVRRMASIAIHHGGVLVEMARVSRQSDAGR